MFSFHLFLAVAVLALAQGALAHYRFPVLIINGMYTKNWQYVRNHTNGFEPIESTNLTSTSMRCNLDASAVGVQTATVMAGSTVGFTVDPYVLHSGVLNVYMARAPGRVADFDGSGNVWFKIHEVKPILNGTNITFTTYNAKEFRFQIPRSIPNGEYLLRIEHIALHLANYVGRAEFYVGCAQLAITNGGKVTPTKTVAFPGAYTDTDPGIYINIYSPVPTVYQQPGPPVFAG